MGKYGRAAPSGVTAAIDLLMFSQVMTRKTTLGSTLNTNFGIDTWGSKTAVVPVKMEYSGTRGVVPYALSFVSTSYWNQRVEQADSRLEPTRLEPTQRQRSRLTVCHVRLKRTSVAQ